MKNSIIAFLLILAYGVKAQDYKIDFVNPTFNGTKYRVTIKMTAKDKPFVLRSNNIRFYYNTSELKNPRIIASQFKEGFKNTTFLGSIPDIGLVSLNTAQDFDNKSSSMTINNMGMELFFLEFDIIKPSAKPTLRWNSDNNMKFPKSVAVQGSSKLLVAKDYATSNSEQLKIYPNPTSNNVKIQFFTTNIEPVEVMLFDISGKEIQRKTENTVSGYNTFDMNTSEIPSGIYLISVQGSSGKITQKLIKQ